MTPRINTADYVRPTTAARAVGLSVQRIKQLLDAGALAHVEIDGHRYVHRRDVDRLAGEVARRRDPAG